MYFLDSGAEEAVHDPDHSGTHQRTEHHPAPVQTDIGELGGASGRKQLDALIDDGNTGETRGKRKYSARKTAPEKYGQRKQIPAERSIFEEMREFAHNMFGQSGDDGREHIEHAGGLYMGNIGVLHGVVKDKAGQQNSEHRKQDKKPLITCQTHSLRSPEYHYDTKNPMK